MLVVGTPELLEQVSTKYVLEKNFLLKNFLFPLTDGLDIVSLNGASWKKWRAIFNPGFNPSQLTKLIPTVVHNTLIFCDQLDKHVETRHIFAMKPLTDNLILDVIGSVTLDVELNSQTRYNKFVHSLRTQIKWMTTGSDNNLLNRYDPMRPFVQYYHGRIVNQYIFKELDQRITSWQNMTATNSHDRNRTIIDLALQAYSDSKTDDSNVLDDPFFRKVCASQLKIFMFAGHDTTSSGICFNLWLLSQHTEALSRTCEEHSKIFGTDPSRAAELMKQSPHLLGQLQYTTAVIKEALRLFTPVTSTRAGRADVNLIDAEGQLLPTEGLVVWSNQHSIHRDASYWASPHVFMPERWLASPDDPLHPTKGMWRPFEQGPRNCIGQELAMLEMKIVLVLVCRTYVFEPAYHEVYGKKGNVQTVLDSEAYQVDIMQPRGNLPLRVKRAT